MSSIVERVLPLRTPGGRERVLSVQGLVKRYGGVDVVRGLSFEIRRGDRTGRVAGAVTARRFEIEAAAATAERDVHRGDQLVDLGGARLIEVETGAG